MHDPVPLSRRIGIIDLGSNSARLMVARYAPGFAFRITDEISRRVRLSEGMAADNRLSPAAMARALETLRMFGTFCQAHGIKQIVPVATAAVRDASNRVEFLSRVRAATGLKLRVLTGEQEAYFGALGVINSLGLRDGLIIDVGGGSAEVSRVSGGRFKRGHTSPLGAVRLTEAFLGSGPGRAKPANVDRLIDHLDEYFAAWDWMDLSKRERFVGLGGTVRALARIDREARGYALGLVHGYELDRRRLTKLIDRLRQLPVRDRARKVEGLQADRADIILAGALVVEAALRQAGAERLVVSGQGIREGLLYREFLKPADPPLIRDPRKFSVLNLGRLYGYEKGHAEHVARLALSLFDQLAARHGDGPAEREALWAAAHLHDIGTVVDYYDHHKHSAYIILNAGLPGYVHRETVLIALLCLYHRKGEPSLGPYAGLFKPGDADRLRRLAALLRLAEYLDRSRAQAVTGLRVRATRGGLRLAVRARRAGGAGVEIWEAQSNAGLFEKVYGCPLIISEA